MVRPSKRGQDWVIASWPKWGKDMQLVKPLIISDSLPDALAQIGQLRDRLKVAYTYNGRPLTEKMRTKLLATLDEMEQDEIRNARAREQERQTRAKEKLDVAVMQRTSGLTEAASAAQSLAAGVTKIANSHALALDAAHEVGTELPDIKGDLQKLAQAAADALKPLSVIIDGKELKRPDEI